MSLRRFTGILEEVSKGCNKVVRAGPAPDWVSGVVEDVLQVLGGCRGPG